jgi:hypothetical protein
VLVTGSFLNFQENVKLVYRDFNSKLKKYCTGTGTVIKDAFALKDFFLSRF